MNETVIKFKHDKPISLVNIGDSHISDAVPENRKDKATYIETAIQKFAEAIQIAKDKKADFIIHDGDLFDHADVSNEIYGEVAAVLKKNTLPFYVVPGGHDLFNHNIKGILKTKLGNLYKSGFVEFLIHPTQNRVILKNSLLSVQLTGTGYHYRIDTPKTVQHDYVLTEKVADKAIHVVHGMLMNKPYMGAFTVVIKDILATLADLTLAGHIHGGFPITHIGEKWFYNSGAIIRKSNDVNEMKRMPKVAYIQVSPQGFVFEDVYLKTARPGDEVLDRTEIIKKQQRIQRSKNFLQQMKQTQNIHALEISDIIDEISKNNQIPDTVVQIALERIAKMQKLMEV